MGVGGRQPDLASSVRSVWSVVIVAARDVLDSGSAGVALFVWVVVILDTPGGLASEVAG